MNKGDLVVIDDTSYSRVVRNGKLMPTPCGFDGYGQSSGKQFTVIEINCTFPKTSCWSGVDCNNTVIQAVDSGEVVFIEERFLRPAKHQIIIDSKTIEVSHESFLNLKAELT